MTRKRIGGRTCALAAIVLITCASPAATTISKFQIQTFAAGGGRVAFVANGLTILDSATGRVVLREPGVSDARLEARPDGLIVATPMLFRPSMRIRFFSSRGDPTWDVTCNLWHPASRHLICVDSWPWARVTIQARSLDDGTVRWTYDTHGAGGEALDANGRLMIANEDVTLESWEQGTYSGTSDVTRVKALTVLDIDTGRVLASTTLPNLRLYGWSGAWPPNHEFDGDRVLFRVKPKPGCNGADVHLYTLGAAAGMLTSTIEECRSTPPPRPSGEPAWTDGEKPWRPILHPLQEGAIVTFEIAGAAALVERRSPLATWQALLPGTREPDQRLQLQRVFEGDGTVFVQASDWGFGTVDALELESGRPLWRYVFPTGATIGSIGVFGPPDEPWPGDLERAWLAVVARPPALLSRADRVHPIEDYLMATDPAGAPAVAVEGPPIVVFDPAAHAQFRAMTTRLVSRWLAIVLGAVFVVVPLGRRLAPTTSMRRVGVAIARFAYLLGVVTFGAPSLLAALVVRLLLVIAFLQTAFAALRVRTARRRWLVRAALALLLLPLGSVLLMLLS